MSLKRRIESLEDKIGIRDPIVYYLVITGVNGNKPIYHYERLIGGESIKLTEEEYQKDQEQELKKGNSFVTDNEIKGLDKLTTEELKILAKKA